MRVLIVDDNIVTQHLFETILSARGHDVTVCGSAEAAWELYHSEIFPLVILDWMLPGMDGLTLCQQMRNAPYGDSSGILVVTSRKNPEDFKKVLNAGADDYLAKPVDIEVLKIRLAIAEQCVTNRLSRKRAEEELSRSRDDMLSILNQLSIGSAITDKEGRITFLSRAAQKFFPNADAKIIGQHWEKSLPIPRASLIKLQESCQLSPKQRKRVPIHVEDGKGQLYWMEVQIENDPRDPERRLFFFYDMSEVHDLRKMLNERPQFYNIVGSCDSMQQIYKYIEDLARVDTTVLIEGETGTGKELVAQAFHFASRRRAKPYVALNCAGLTESLISSQLFGHKKGSFTGAIEDHRGLFEAADGGTLFLDEIGDIPMSVQTALLRVLQEREITRLGETKPRKIDVRILAATHRNLSEEVVKGNFRQDLLYRIRVARIQLPALRDRREDIPLLVSTFLRQSAALIGKSSLEVSNEAMHRLMTYNWPGNVRELRSAMEFAAIRCGGSVIQLIDLPSEIYESSNGNSNQYSIREPIVQQEKGRLIKALEKARGNRSEAARILGISRATFYRRLAEFDIVNY